MLCWPCYSEALCTACYYAWLLTVLFAWKVAVAMPSWAVAATVWAMAVRLSVFSMVDSFVALLSLFHDFIIRERQRTPPCKISDKRMERGGADVVLAVTGGWRYPTSGMSAYRAAAARDVGSTAFLAAGCRAAAAAGDVVGSTRADIYKNKHN